MYFTFCISVIVLHIRTSILLVSYCIFQMPVYKCINIEYNKNLLIHYSCNSIVHHVGHVGGDALPQLAVHHDEEDALEELELIEEEDEYSWQKADQVVTV